MPPGSRYLLDTSVVIELLSGRLAAGGDRGRGGMVYTCATVVGELSFGAARSRRPDANRLRIAAFLETCPMVAHDVLVAHRYGELKAVLADAGRLIPENDMWIAATALRHGLILVARDHHFDAIAELQREAW